MNKDEKIKTIELLRNGITPGLKMSELEDLGIFSEEITDTEDFKVITRIFTSYDKGFRKVITIYIPKETKEDEVREIELQIAKAVAAEDYEEAALLQKRKQAIIQS